MQSAELPPNKSDEAFGLFWHNLCVHVFVLFVCMHVCLGAGVLCVWTGSFLSSLPSVATEVWFEFLLQACQGAHTTIREYAGLFFSFHHVGPGN